MGWRSAFAIVGGIALLTVAMVYLFLPFIAAGNASIRGELGVFRRLQVWLTLLMVAIGFGGMFAMYTYVTPTLQQITHASPLEISVLLGLIGVGMTVGSLVGGWFADRNQTATIFGVLVWEALVLAAFAYTSSNLWLAGLNLFLIGTGIAVVPAVQTRLMDVAGDAQTVAAALNHSAFNIANALGAWAGGVTIAAGYGLQSTALVGAILPLGGIAVLAVSLAVERNGGARAAVPAA
jgi:DHA1 family inner membrane transport protein